MKRALTIGITFLASLSLAACSSDSSSSSKTSSTSSSMKDTGVTLSQYNSVKLGDNGTTKKQVKKMFGKATIETETEVPGATKKATQYSWSKVASSLKGATVNVDFIDGVAVGKGYVSASISHKISDAKYKAVQTGTIVKDVKKQLGTPEGESISKIGSMNAQDLSYVQGTKSVSFSFMNDKLVTKSKTDLGESN